MKAVQFARDVLIILCTKVGVLVLSVLSSVVLARALGPEGRGIYALAVLFPSLIMTFANLGLGPATVYYVAQGKYLWREVFESNVLICLGLGLIGCLVGVAALLGYRNTVFPEVPRALLFLTLLLVPLDLFRQQMGEPFLLGAKRIQELSLASIAYSLVSLVLLLVVTQVLGGQIVGILWGNVASSAVLCIVLYWRLSKLTGGWTPRLSWSYVRDAARYGAQAYLGNVVGFLNYRIEMFLLGALLPASAVGYYSIAVGMAEKLWLVSQSAATLVFPAVAAERDNRRDETLTPLVSRTVSVITAIGAVILFLLAPWFIPLLYSQEYTPAVELFRILLPGIVLLSSSRIFANDIAGRGRPILNTYMGTVSLLLQVGLNAILIPELGPVGSAWASTVSYGIDLIVRVCVYISISDSSLFDVVLPKHSDWVLYRKLAELAWRRLTQGIVFAWPHSPGDP